MSILSVRTTISGTISSNEASRVSPQPPGVDSASVVVVAAGDIGGFPAPTTSWRSAGEVIVGDKSLSSSNGLFPYPISCLSGVSALLLMIPSPPVVNVLDDEEYIY